ncbi:MAG: DUF5590 domain-containing protein [Bacillus sp. (in: firmicutes)]
MKKWIISIGILLLLFVGYVIASFYIGMDYKKTAEEEAVAIALKEGGLVSVSDYYLYHGQEAYSVVVGKDDEGTEYVLWIPKDIENASVKKMKYEEGVSENEIVATVKEKYNPKEIVSVKIGIKDSSPIWEVTYKDSDDNLVFADFDFKK